MIKTVLYTIFFVVLIGAVIIFKSYSDKDGYISNDSSTYLKVVENIKSGFGLNIQNDKTMSDSKRIYFTIQPVGYPLAIYYISSISKITPFLASKIVNILAVLLCAFSLILIFKERSLKYILLLIASPIIEIFTFSWTEGSFLAFSLLFLLALITFEKRNYLLSALYVAIAGVLMFLFRYIGLISVPALAIIALIEWKENKKKSITLLLSGGVILSIAAIYLSVNYLNAGNLTGYRIPAPESFFQIIKNSIKWLITSINLLASEKIDKSLYYILFLFQLIILASGFTLLKKKSEITISIKELLMGNKIRLYFSVFVALYTLSITLLRAFVQFDTLDFRFMAPPGIMLFMILFNYFEEKKGIENFYLFVGFVLVIGFGLNLNRIGIDPEKKNPTANYQTYIAALKLTYILIPPESVVVSYNKHFNYLRSDCCMVAPYSWPYSPQKETFDELKVRLAKFGTKNIYIDHTFKIADTTYFDASIIAQINASKKGFISRIKL